MSATLANQVLRFPVGQMTDVGSLCKHLSGPLELFSAQYQQGISPDVIWDLRKMRYKVVNFSTLTAFLAVACRVRRFTTSSAQVELPDDERLLDFLADISFFEIGRELDLWHFQTRPRQALIKPHRSNPNSNIFVFGSVGRPPSKQDHARFNAWKDFVRGEVKKELLLRCGPLFRPRGGKSARLKDPLVDELAITCAELALNAVIHGRSPAFIGLQRSSARISVAISDSGIGFLDSLNERSLLPTKHSMRRIPTVQSDLAAILLGSLVNQNEYGVRRTIDMVLRYGGWTEISSGNAKIEWRQPLWDHAVATTEKAFELISEPSRILETYPQQLRHVMGSYETFACTLRGSRVSFELPLDS